MIPPFKWLYTFLSTPEEWHAFIEGFCDVFFPFVMRYHPSKDLREAIECEHHYYNFGRVVGFIALVWFAIGIYKVLT